MVKKGNVYILVIIKLFGDRIMNTEIESAKELLSKPLIVAVAIKIFDSIIKKNYDVRRIEPVQKDPKRYSHTIMWINKFRPYLNAALNGQLPNDEEFGLRLEWYNSGYPLEGLIKHEIGGVRNFLRNEEFYRQPSLSERVKKHLQIQDELPPAWLLDKTGKYILALETVVEEIIEEGISRLNVK